MSLYNVVPTHIRFNIDVPVLTNSQARNSSRGHTLRGGKPKTPKSQKSKTFLRGPKLLNFWVFLGFLVFQQTSEKSHGVFWTFSGKPNHNELASRKCVAVVQRLAEHRTSRAGIDFQAMREGKQGVFGFVVRSLVKNPKNHVFFWNQKTPCVFLDFCWKSKNPRKTQKSKSLGPLRKVLDFWFCIAFGGNQKTQNPKIKNFLRGPKLLDFLVFLGFFCFPTEIQTITSFFLRFWV